MSKNIFTGIDHVGLAAENVETLSSWYCETLGFKKTFTGKESGVTMIIAPDKTMIEVLPCDDSKRPVRNVKTPGWSHFVMRVNDMDRACKYLESRGIVFAGDEFAAQGGGRVRNFYDPEGNMLQIVWRESI